MLRLLFPALMPSWRFFDRIGAAPSLEFGVTRASADAVTHWRAVRTRPPHVSLGRMLASLVWNPRGNESLYLVSCAERLIDDPSAARADALWRRVASVVRDEPPAPGADAGAFMRIRVVEVAREQGRLVRHVAFVSEPRRLDEADGAPAR